MKERPILFSGPLVRALLAGTKTQTRRLVKRDGVPIRLTHESHYLQPMYGVSPPPDPVAFGERGLWREVGPDYPDDSRDNVTCPFGAAGDRLWVRERLVEDDAGCWRYFADNKLIELAADDSRCPAMIAWAHHREDSNCVSIHMPRWASRLTLEVTAIRAERLQSISEEDARAEGVTIEPQQGTLNGEPAKLYPMTHRQAFIWLWDRINGERAAWSSNPWVWVIEFSRVDARQE